MSPIQKDGKGGVSAFIAEQAWGADDSTRTLARFDKKEVGPRGMSPLFDAVDRAIDETRKRLPNMPEQGCHELVVVVEATDGLEKSSSEYNQHGHSAFLVRRIGEAA